MTELMACPFCGSADVGAAAGPDSEWVMCNACGAEGPWATDQTEAQAIAAWNTRATPSPQTGWRDDMENAPRDGTDILVAQIGVLPIRAKWDSRLNTWCAFPYLMNGDVARVSGKDTPTHWQPLPAPPVKEIAR